MLFKTLIDIVLRLKLLSPNIFLLMFNWSNKYPIDWNIILSTAFKLLSRVNINISSSSLREQIDIKYIPSEIKNDILNLTKGKSFWIQD